MFRRLRNRAVLYPMAPRPLNTTLKAYSVGLMSGHERQDVDNGGKIILPPQLLQQLTHLNVTYPMLFRISNTRTGRVTHCGVLEFIAEDGRCYLPHWMMLNLALREGDNLQIQSVTLPTAAFSKFEPQSVDFLEVSNPKAMLENALRNFACLTTGDTIAIHYNGKAYELRVLETKPGNAVTIIECDMDVDFAPPVGYVEPVYTPMAGTSENAREGSQNYAPVQGFSAFVGSGNRLDGKDATEADSTAGQPVVPTNQIRGIPDYDFQLGTLEFVRDFSCFQKIQQVEGEGANFTPFGGAGTSLGKANKNRVHQ